MEKLLKDPKYNNYHQKFGKPTVKISKNYSCHTFLPKADSLNIGDIELPDDTIGNSGF